jgi:hypothetical protein
MPTQMIFQYLAPGSKRPEEKRIAPAWAEVRPGDTVPNVGDIITIIPPPSEGLSNFEKFKVVTRHFFYTRGGPRQDEVVDSQVFFLIVTDPDEDDITVIDHRRVAQPPKDGF